jgi:hypothetical protein
MGRFFDADGVCFVGLLPLLTGNVAAAFDPALAHLWLRIAAAVILSAITIALSDLQTRRAQQDPPGALREFLTDVRAWSGPGWVRRTAWDGLKMGLAIGLPIGSLFLLLPGDSDQTFGDRIASSAAFLAVTLLWTQAAVFAVRWLWLRLVRNDASRL